jgi:hypothetical protein
VLVAVLLFCIVLQSVGHIWQTLGRHELGGAVDLDRSNGIPDLLSTVVIATAAAGAAGLAGQTAGPARRRAAALACTLALVGAEDLLHLRPERTASGVATGVTAVIGLALLLWLAVEPATGLRARCTLTVGLVALSASLVAGELPQIDQWFERARGDPVIEWQIVAKQGLELAGWWLVAVALWDAAGLARRRLQA